MKNTFPGYYRPTEDILSEMWGKCLFVLDANVLLNLYRYSPETREELLDILEGISDRLWVPHQTALEYHRNRLAVIGNQATAYDSVQKLLDGSRKKLENDLRSLTGKGRHPFINADHLLERITIVFTEINEEMKGLYQEHPDLIDEDPIRDTITTLLDGKIGSPYPSERLGEIYKAGKKRYEREIPPGYQDAAKGNTGQFSDLVLWFQIIDQAKAAKVPIILVTDDRKDDWWLKFKGQTIGPRPELINEIVSDAGVSFYMYSADPFMEHAREYLERQISQQAIEEVREVRQRDDEYSMAAHLARSGLFPNEAMRAALRLPDEAMRSAMRLPDEAMRAAMRFPDEAMRSAMRLPDEAMRAAMRLPDEAMRAAMRFPDEAMRAAMRLQDEALIAMRAALRLQHETLETRRQVEEESKESGKEPDE